MAAKYHPILNVHLYRRGQRVCFCGCGTPVAHFWARGHGRRGKYGCRAGTHPDNFWGLVDKHADGGCWVWTGRTNSLGYGRVSGDRQQWYAHRYAYTLIVGPIADGLTLDHLCRNRACVNPSHLEAVPLGVNVLRGESPHSQNSRKTHCKHGHEFTPENTKIVKNGRECRICHNRRNAEYKRRKQGKAA